MTYVLKRFYDDKNAWFGVSDKDKAKATEALDKIKQMFGVEKLVTKKDGGKIYYALKKGNKVEQTAIDWDAIKATEDHKLTKGFLETRYQLRKKFPNEAEFQVSFAVSHPKSTRSESSLNQRLSCVENISSQCDGQACLEWLHEEKNLGK